MMWCGMRHEQQDALLVHKQLLQHEGALTQRFELNSPFLMAVADGVSSSPHAGRAAKHVLSAIRDQWEGRHAINWQEVQTSLCDRLADALETQGSATTLAIAECTSNGLNATVRISHLGDSRVYHYSPKKDWQCLTRDHSVLEEMRDDGLLQADVEYASMYGALTKYLVADRLHDLLQVSTMVVEVAPREWLLVCTDGVYGVLPLVQWPAIDEKVDLKTWLKEMHRRVHQQGAHDNGSLVIARFG